MNIRRGKIGGIALIGAIFAFVSPGRSAEIVMESYRYETDMPVHFPEEETFVICDCPEPAALARTPVMPPLVLKISASNKPQRQHSGLTRLKPFETTVIFDFDSDKLRPIEKEKVKKAITQINGFRGKPHIQILGYTSDFGPATYNQNLSLRRAETVAALFRSGNLNPKVIAGKGRCCPVSKTRSLNRRVEIIIQEGEPS